MEPSSQKDRAPPIVAGGGAGAGEAQSTWCECKFVNFRSFNDDNAGAQDNRAWRLRRRRSMGWEAEAVSSMEETEVIPQQAVIPFPMEEREGRKGRLIPLEAWRWRWGCLFGRRAGLFRWSRWSQQRTLPRRRRGGSPGLRYRQTNTAGANAEHGSVVITALTPLPFELNSLRLFRHRGPTHRDGGGRDHCNRIGQQLYLRLVSSYISIDSPTLQGRLVFHF